MDFKYNDTYQRYEMAFGYHKAESCNCNEEIIQFLNNNSICEMNNLIIYNLNHIAYDIIEDKINNKLHVKELSIWLTNQNQKTFNFKVLKLLFYSDEIEKMFITYNQWFDFDKVDFKNLKYLRIEGLCDEWEALMPNDIVDEFPFIVNHCPNIQELDIERTFEDDSLDFIIQTLIKLNKNLKIKFNYLDSGYFDYKEKDELYIKNNNNVEKIDEDTIFYKLPNIGEEEKICVTLNAICYYCRYDAYY